MLSAIRKRQKILLSVFVTLISITFVFWGFYGGFGGGSLGTGDVAAVNGDGITSREFQTQYQNSLQLYQNILKDKFTPEMAERFNLKQITLNQLIDQKILIQGAKNLGLKVTNEQVKDAIVNTGVFQKEGSFNKEYYLLLLKNNRLTPKSYEETVRLDLLRRKILDLINSHIQISAVEVKTGYILQNDKANLEFITIDPEALKNKVTISQKDIDRFLAGPENKTAAQQYYDSNGHLYKQEHEVRARHILIKGKDEASKKKIEEIQQTLTSENFSEMAKKHSQDGSAKDGGDLGFFGKGKMVKPFEEAAFSLKPGALSNIVESQFGFHIIKTEEIKQERVKPFDEVKNSISKILLEEQKSSDEAKKIADQIWAVRQSNSNIKNILKSQNLKWAETGSFSLGTSVIPKIGKAEDLKKQAFTLKKGQFASQPFNLRDRYYIVRMKKREKADLKKFNKDKDKISTQSLSRKQSDAYYAWLKELKDTAKIVVRKTVLEQM